ncbi:hypothetical protein [Veronia pacifica]
MPAVAVSCTKTESSLTTFST